MPTILFKNAALLDPLRSDLLEGHHVLVEDRLIKEVSDRPIEASVDRVIDLKGKTLMPGLIDLHVHAVAVELDLSQQARMANVLVTLRSTMLLRGMLKRGFTTVRDAGGAGYALKQAIDTGLTDGPRLFVSGRALSQTGGHGDGRARSDYLADPTCSCCVRVGAIARVVDGVDAVRKAVREELQMGADQIKIMASGGVASPTDPIGAFGYSEDEIRAIVAEAKARHTYVLAHAYTAEAIERAVRCGVRTIEHGNLIDDASAKLMAEKGMFLIANLVTYYAMRERAAEFGMGGDMLAKNDLVIDGGLKSLETCKRAGIPVAYGTDLLGALQMEQSREFTIRAQVLSPIEIIRSATTIGARIVRQEGKLGTLKAGAYADLLLIDGDPLKDLGLFQEQGKHLAAIMKGGKFHKNRLN